MLRRHPNALLSLSIALLAAAAIGVQLGRSAIAEINPVHFRGPLERPRAMDPAARTQPADPYAAAYGWDEAFAARAAACGGDCDARHARDAFAVALEVPRSHAPGPAWRDATPTAEPAPWRAGETGGAPLSVERYMHYPVEAAVAEADDPLIAADSEGNPR